MKTFIIIASAMLASLSAVEAQTPGDWVLARYKNGRFWFPGVIQSVNGDRITIQYDDGDRETLYLNSVRPYNWSIGARVQCNFRGAGTWYGGRITALSGGSLSIAYDDGDFERTTTGRCRSN